MSDDERWAAPGSASPTPPADPAPTSSSPAAPYGPPQPDDRAPQPGYGPPQYGAPRYGPPQPSAPQYGAPHYGPPQYVPPQYGTPQAGVPQYGAPGFAPPTAGQRPLFVDPAAGPAPQRPLGWTPPPKPGLIPLAPLGFGTILGAPYRAFRRNPRPTFGASLLIQGGVTFLTILVVGLVAFASFSRVDFASTTAEENELVAGAFGVTALSAVVPIVLSLLAVGVMQGVISLEIARQSLGEKLTFRQLWQRARGRLLAVGWYTLALSGSLLVVLAVIVGIALVPFLFGGAGIGIGIVLVVLLYLGLLVTAFALTTKLAFVPSVIVLEKVGVLAGVRRSWQLTRGAFWRILGTLLLVNAIFGFANSVVTQVPILAGAIIASVIDPTGNGTGFIVVIVVAYLVALVLTLLISALMLVVQSGTATLLYLDRRIRTEGLDLELQQFVEARQSGATDLTDPYEAAASRAAGDRSA